MAGVAGFEPAHDGIKTRCLTTWRHPNAALFLYKGRGKLKPKNEKNQDFVQKGSAEQSTVEKLEHLGEDDRLQKHVQAIAFRKT